MSIGPPFQVGEFRRRYANLRPSRVDIRNECNPVPWPLRLREARRNSINTQGAHGSRKGYNTKDAVQALL